MELHILKIKKAWLADENVPRRLTNLFFTVTIVTSIMLSFASYLRFIESRPGAFIDDPILAIFAPIDLTWPIFVVTYPTLIIGLMLLVHHADRFIVALQAYGLMMLMRMGMMYITPLEPPPDTIPLVDPFVETAGKTGFVPTKDLFFSGHTGSMFMVAINMVNPIAKILFLGVTVFIGTAVVLQKVHYVVDVAVAPFVAYGCLQLVRSAQKKASRWY